MTWPDVDSATCMLEPASISDEVFASGSTQHVYLVCLLYNLTLIDLHLT